MNDKRNLRAIQAQRFLRYSIRKFSVGVASVAIASGLAVLGGVNVQAAEEVTPNTEAVETAKKDEKPVVEKVDKTSLNSAIARLEAALEKAASTEKTASAIESAKAELANAKAIAANEAATKEEVAKATSAVKGKAFVVESMPKATADKKEEKENKNQDPRNGQAIPGQGESGFRAVDTTAANAASEAEKYKGIRDAAIPELQANIDKIQAQIAKEEALPANKKDQFKIDVLKGIKQKAENVITTANAADTTSAQKMSQQAEAVKSERDLLALYLAGKAELGAPISENHVAYGNNPANGVFESLKEGFGDKVTFTDADKKSETVTQYESPRDLTNKLNNKPGAKDPIGSATYNWQEKAITKADAEKGVLNGWKIEVGEKVNAVKPLDVTNITDKDGNPSTRKVPKSKIYTNEGELKKYQTSGENTYVNGSGISPTVTPTIDKMRNNSFGEVKNRDYYLELGSKGNTISKEYDVNGNSRLNVNLIHSAGYGVSTKTEIGERVKLKIVDAFTGEEIKPVEGVNGPLSTEAGPTAGNGWTHLNRIYDIPATTTKVKVLIEAGDQGTNGLLKDKNVTLKDGYLIGGIGIATAPAAEVVTNVRSENKSGEYGYTKDTIYDKGQKGTFDVTIKNTGGMNIDYYSASNADVTVEVPKGVILDDKIVNANGGSTWLGNVWANNVKYTPNDPNDKSKGGTLTYSVPAGSRMAAAEKNSRTTSIPFTTADNFVGPADFKVTVNNGFGDTDAEGNRLFSYTNNGLNTPYKNQFSRNGLANSDNPEYKYGKVIFINSLKANSVVTVPINTSEDDLKKVAYAKAQETINSADFQKLLADVSGTAALDGATNIKVVNKDNLAITKVAEDGRGVVQVPVTYTVDGKTYETTVDVEVNVVESKTKPVVVFEGDTIKPTDVTAKVNPSNIAGATNKVNEPKASDIFKTDGKAGETGLTIPTTITHTVNGTDITEDVTVPVTVLPKASGEVTVPKGTTPEKLKELAKEKALAATKDSDFTSKLPDNAVVTVGDVTEEVLATLTAEKGENKGVVNVPVTYKIPGDDTPYTTTIPVTVNVQGSEVKPIYVVEGKKPEVDKVKSAVTPGDGGTVQNPKESDLPDTTGKAGDQNVVVPTTIKYPNGEEKVEVPVKVVKGNPQIIPVDQGQPLPENSVNTKDYPEGSTFEYEKVDGKDPVNTSEAGDYPVTVVVKDKDGNILVKVPTKVRVVDSYRQYVPVNTDPTKVIPAENIVPTDFPDGTTFEYLTPVDTTTPGDKDVVVVAKLNGEPIAEIPAKVTVVEPKTQYVAVGKEPDVSKSVDSSVFPKESEAKPEYKEPVDTTTPGIKDVNVVVKDKDGDSIVEVPAKVIVVKGKDQVVPVNPNVEPKPEDSINPADYPKGSTFKYKETPDTTKVGDNNVVVEVRDENGNLLVEVPAIVKVVASTPGKVVVFDGDKPTLDNNAVTPGEGGTVGEPTKVPNTTGKAGAKDVEVEVPVTYENGKFKETVKVPVTVLPKPVPGSVIIPKDLPETELKSKIGKDAENAINNDEFKKKLPEGATVKVDLTNITLPKTSTPGKVGEVEVPVIYTVDGKEYKTTVKIPVTVVEGKEQLVPKGDTPNPQDNITPSDYPEGATFEYDTPVDTSKPGKKEAVVIVKDKDGKEIVRVPVVVNVVEPKVTPIIVPERTKLTKEDVQKHIEIPGVTGWEIVGEPELPETFPAGVRPSATVTVKLPNGKIMKVQVPVIATPTVTPIVVPQGTPITKEDVKKHIDIPKESGWEIIEIGEIPTTETPGDKTAVKVKVKLPTGEVIELEVPVKVTPNEAPAVKVVTHFVDENGKDITSPEEGLKDPRALEGYVFDKTTTDKNGVVFHHYKKVTASAPVAKQELPNTGMSESNVFTPAVLAILGGLGLAAPAVVKKKDEE